MIQDLVKKIKLLNESFPDIITYKNQQKSSKDIAKYFGRIPGKIDSDFFSFISHFNTVSIADLKIFGLKEHSLDIDLYTLTTNNWLNNNMLSGYFISFGQTSFGQIVGFLNHYRTESGEIPIGYLSDIFSPSLIVISSSFTKFMEVLLSTFEKKVAYNSNKVSLVASINETLSDLDFWLQNDSKLSSAYNLKMYKSDLTENWKIHNGF